MRRNKKINQRNSKGNPEGYWEHYYDNGQLSWKGNYVNGNREGYWEGYYYNGQLRCKGYWVRGEEVKGIEYEEE